MSNVVMNGVGLPQSSRPLAVSVPRNDGTLLPGSVNEYMAELLERRQLVHAAPTIEVSGGMGQFPEAMSSQTPPGATALALTHSVSPALESSSSYLSHLLSIRSSKVHVDENAALISSAGSAIVSAEAGTGGTSGEQALVVGKSSSTKRYRIPKRALPVPDPEAAEEAKRQKKLLKRQAKAARAAEMEGQEEDKSRAEAAERKSRSKAAMLIPLVRESISCVVPPNVDRDQFLTERIFRLCGSGEKCDKLRLFLEEFITVLRPDGAPTFPISSVEAELFYVHCMSSTPQLPTAADRVKPALRFAQKLELPVEVKEDLLVWSGPATEKLEYVQLPSPPMWIVKLHSALSCPMVSLPALLAPEGAEPVDAPEPMVLESGVSAGPSQAVSLTLQPPEIILSPVLFDYACLHHLSVCHAWRDTDIKGASLPVLQRVSTDRFEMVARSNPTAVLTIVDKDKGNRAAVRQIVAFENLIGVPGSPPWAPSFLNRYGNSETLFQQFDARTPQEALCFKSPALLISATRVHGRP